VTSAHAASASISPAGYTDREATNAAPIVVGAVLGGMATILFTLSVILFLCRRSRARAVHLDKLNKYHSESSTQAIPDDSEPRAATQ
jgi:hypothetical protein